MKPQIRMFVYNSFKFKIKKLYPTIFLWLFFSIYMFAQEPNTIISSENKQENAIKKDSALLKTKDSILLKDEKKQKQSQIDAEIKYNAKDSIVFWGNGTGFLHGESEIKYKNINLKADYARIKMDSSLIFARYTKDSAGVRKGEPEFSEGDKKYTSRELTYNLKTRKGYISQAVTQEGEGYIISERTKKGDDETFCMAGGKFTTCDNHDHPHFYLSMSKGKVKPGEYIVTGPAHLVIADVPLPLFIPFGFFPFTSKYSSGFLMPSYSDELNRGFGFTNGGWYFAVNDYVDLEIRTDLYTKGTWAFRANSSYRKNYKYSGSFGLEYRNDVTGNKGFANYNPQKSFSLRWSHSQDQKANPNLTISGSVNFSTSGFNRNNINYYARPELTSENTKNSSINFTKRFPTIPSLSISGGVSMSQRTRDSTISLDFPNLSISYSRFYPLKRKNAVGKERWYEKITMSYSGSLANSITTKESKLLTSSFQRDWRNGMRHSIPVSASFNLLKYINISPYFNYTERWYLLKMNKTWSPEKNQIITDTLSKFSRVYDFNTGVSASTKIYGFYIPNRKIFGDKVDRIRHVITPNIGFGYTPDFGDAKWGYYDKYTTTDKDGLNPTQVDYSHYEGSLYGSPGKGKSGNINFSVSNNVELKYRNDKDTTGIEPFKILSLIDNLSIGGAYNLAGDSMRWSDFQTSIRLKLTKTYALFLSASFNPYMYGLDKNGNPVKINQLRWNHGGFPRFTGTSTSYRITLNNDTFKKLFAKKEKQTVVENKSGNTPATDLKPNDNSSINNSKTNKNAEKVTDDKDGYKKNNINWNVNLDYFINLKYTEFDKSKMEYKMGLTHSLSMSGNLDLTKNWKINFTPTIDIKTLQFLSLAMNVNRSLHCWSMSVSLNPIGPFKSYNFHLGVNSSMLADLKYDKQKERELNNVNWY